MTPTTPTEIELPQLPRVGPIGYASIVDVETYAPWLKIGPHLPGVRDVALWTSDQLRAYARAAILADRSRREVPEDAKPVTMTDSYLLEEFAKRAGMTSLLNMGAASCVHSEGCHGVTQAHLTKFCELVAAYAVNACAEVHAAMLAGRPQVDQDARDAKRYRSLRNHRGQEHDWFIVTDTATDETLWGADLDHRIDEFHASSTGESK